MLLPVFSLVVMMIFPAYGAVESVSLEKSFYTDEELMVFVGTEDSGKKSVFVIIRGPGGDFIGMFSDPASDNDGAFSTIARPVENYFTSSGTYNATAFTDDQKEEDGLTIFLQYDGTKVSEKEDFVLTLKSIPDKTITEGKTLSFTVGVTDSSLDKLTFSLDKNPPSGASIESSTGKFIWTPSASQGNSVGIQYNFDIVVERGAQKDSESITITVKDPVVDQPKDEPKDEP
ncbi:MAG: putative Ig domain-containing protein, partial [Candidatus Nitrosomaritimum aestuariumsis]